MQGPGALKSQVVRVKKYNILLSVTSIIYLSPISLIKIPSSALNLLCMKRTSIINVITCILLLPALSCQQDSAAEFDDCHFEDVIESVSDMEGIVWYDTQVKAYCIFSGVDGTYDLQIIGIVCNDLPDAYKAEGVKVLYSGHYYDCKEFSAPIPGQKYYYLKLIMIELDSER